MSKLKYSLLLLLVAGYFLPIMAAKDSATQTTDGFGVQLSFNPLIKSFARDSAANFLYSHNVLEVNYRFKKHQVGVGFDGNQVKSSTTVNGLDKKTDKVLFCFAPNYLYNFWENRKWRASAGVGYFRNSIKTTTDVISKIEVITQEVKQVESGFNLFMRFGLKLSRRLSLEMEMSAYKSIENIEYKDTYTLNTGMNSTKKEDRSHFTYAFPSNFSVRYSF